ncbi:MAG TPA: NAD(P)H-quinone oxidoreductase [Polyangiaceae bacterium]|jgi:putative PIG3 family NAD(P)H quinone oxidoreductase|nr:NAD(P)H-quinone oxidoreductase [Polyangiaceae bacterium]
MKAIVVSEPGGPENLGIADVPAPELGPGKLLVNVRATALNRADLLQRRGLYPPPRGESEVLGMECSGEVAELGEGVGSFRVGDRVMALLPGGGYAEQVVVPEKMAIPMPAGMSFTDAAAIPEAFLTAREALFTLGRTRADDVVLVHAAGSGVGSAAVQVAREAGARVVATAGSAEKLARVGELGAHVLVNYRTDDFVEAVKKESSGRGANVILDFIGASYWPKHAACLAVGGRCVCIGVLGGASAEVNLAQLLMRRYQLLGLVMRARDVSEKIAITQAFIRETLPLFEKGRLHPVVDKVFRLDQATEAHQRMESNENFGKIVLTT